jgi:biotin-(acetyl-CoA carboxylase) ligase
MKENNSLIRSSYIAKLYLFDCWTGFRSRNQEFIGKINNVNESGKLIVSDKTGNIYSFDNKEVEFIQL